MEWGTGWGNGFHIVVINRVFAWVYDSNQVKNKLIKIACVKIRENGPYDAPFKYSFVSLLEYFLYWNLSLGNRVFPDSFKVRVSLK